MPHREKGKKKHRSRPANTGTGIRVRGRLWIDGPEDTFIGYGRVVLLERIRELGSISKAAKSMDISYRHAWELVESMNRQARAPLVVTSTGGNGGGGATVTEEGEKAIGLFKEIYEQFQTFIREREKKIKKLCLSG
jgi:molybdate transport system regulatory protein